MADLLISGVPGHGQMLDTPRTQDPVIVTDNDEPQDAPLTHAVPQGEPEAFDEAYLQAHEGQQSEEGGWTRIGTVIGEGKRETFRAGPKIKIEGGDDRASIHLNNIPYKGTFTEIGPDGKPAAGVYPLYEGVLSTGLSGAFATDRVFELYGPDDTKFDWSFEIVPFEKSCDNCGQPMIKVYEWHE